MSEELEVDDDVFLEEGVLYCICGNPIEAEDASGLIEKDGGREYVTCPTCDMRHYAEGGKFLFDE